MFDGLLWIALAMLMALDWPESSLAIIRLLTGAAALKENRQRRSAASSCDLFIVERPLMPCDLASL